MKDDQILDSWKEITEYLGRSRKTCLRWEKEFGLPIHRLDGTPKARVFAYRDELDRWLEETLKGKESPQKLSSPFFIKLTSLLKSKRLIIPGLIMALAIIAIVIWQLIPRGKALMASKIENSIAIVNFANETNDTTCDHLQKVIPNLLRTNLENTNLFYVVTNERMRDICMQLGNENVDFIDNDLGFEICRREGIEALVTGFYTKGGDIFTTAVTVYDVDTKESLSSISSSGIGEQSFFESQIDELSQKIAQGIGIPAQRVETVQFNIADVTTSSMPAYRFFLKGREEYEKSYFDEARLSLKRAIELDPTFAMAYLYLAQTMVGLFDTEGAIENLNNARKFSHWTSEKDKLFIEAFFAGYVDRKIKKCVQILKQIAEKYPKEKRAFYLLGRFASSVEEEIDFYVKALELDATYGPALHQLAFHYGDIGNNEKAIEYFQKYAALYPDDAKPIDSIAEQYLRMGELDDAIAFYKKALEMRPDFGSGWKISYIYALKENYSEALEYIDSYITTAPSEGTRVHGYAWRGFLNCWLGNYEQSLDDLRQGEALGKAHGNLVWISNIIWMRGWLFYEMKEYELARICFKSKYDAKVGIASSAPLNKFFYYMDVGSVDFAQGRIDSANSKLEKMELLLPELDSYFAYTEKSRLDLFHCELLLAKGLAKRTIDYYRKATPVGGLPNLRGDYYFRYNTPFLKDVLARAYQKNGELDKAIEEYKKLINFDPNRKERLLIHPKYYYRLAKLYEEKNLKGEAREQYQRFLELWKDAVPGMVEVDDARERLARLNKP